MGEPTSLVEINGCPPTVEDLHVLASRNYGHFTSMQVRDGAVRGWELHMQRVRESSLELFGKSVDAERVRELVAHALREAASAVSVRINVFSVLARPGETVDPDVMVTVSPPVSDVPASPWRVRSTQYERDSPHIKHVGTFGLAQQRRFANAAGFDDVLFVDRTGNVTEGSIWNIGFWDGEQVVWPQGGMLSGITMQLVVAGLERIGAPSVTRPVTIDEIGSFRAAFATYSWCPAQPVGSVDDTTFAADSSLDELLATSWNRMEPEAV